MFDWKITQISAEDGVITHAHYVCKLIQEPYTVETEGNYYFNEPAEKVPFLEVTEELMAQWLEKEAIRDGVNHIVENVKKQIEALKSHKATPAPWLPQIFKPEI